MTRSGGKAGGRQGQAQRKELFSAEDLSLQWREVRKAVSGGGADLVWWATACQPQHGCLGPLQECGTQRRRQANGQTAHSCSRELTAATRPVLPRRCTLSSTPCGSLSACLSICCAGRGAAEPGQHLLHEQRAAVADAHAAPGAAADQRGRRQCAPAQRRRQRLLPHPAGAGAVLALPGAQLPRPPGPPELCQEPAPRQQEVRGC